LSFLFLYLFRWLILMGFIFSCKTRWELYEVYWVISIGYSGFALFFNVLVLVIFIYFQKEGIWSSLMLTCYIGFGIDLDGFYFLEMLQIYGAYPLFAIILCNNGFDQCKFNRVEFGLSLVGAVWAWMPNRYPKPDRVRVWVKVGYIFLNQVRVILQNSAHEYILLSLCMKNNKLVNIYFSTWTQLIKLLTIV
jgi:hypothetical protein